MDGLWYMCILFQDYKRSIVNICYKNICGTWWGWRRADGQTHDVMMLLITACERPRRVGGNILEQLCPGKA